MYAITKDFMPENVMSIVLRDVTQWGVVEIY
jgi:hypothetical protein